MVELTLPWGGSRTRKGVVKRDFVDTTVNNLILWSLIENGGMKFRTFSN